MAHQHQLAVSAGRAPPRAPHCASKPPPASLPPPGWPQRAHPARDGAVACAALPESEAARLATAAAILGAVPGGDARGDAAWGGGDAALQGLSVLDELRVLDADSLGLAVGILRARAPPGDAETQAGVALSERLLELLALLRVRPGRTPAGSPARHAHGVGAAAGRAADDGFFAGPDEWADVRAALLSIGIHAGADGHGDNDDDDDDGDDEQAVWDLDEPGSTGPTRRTRLLRSLPRLDADTAAQLAAFLAEAAQRTAPQQPRPSAEPQQQARRTGDGPPVEDEEDEDAAWWAAVSHCYQRLWQQAREQQGVRGAAARQS